MTIRRPTRLLVAAATVVMTMSSGVLAAGAAPSPSASAAPPSPPAFDPLTCDGSLAPQSVPAPVAPIGPDWTSRAFFTAMLTQMKLPATDENLNALYSVEHFEGDNDRYNPLNVVQPMPGSVSYNSVGVQTYATFTTGVGGTVKLFSNAHWAGVRGALAKGTSTEAVIASFQAAYTWTSGVTFPSNEKIWNAEAIRDVGGPYSDAAFAAQRVATILAPMEARVHAELCAMTAARNLSASARADWARQTITYAEQRTRYAANLSKGSADQLIVNNGRGRILSALVAEYRNGPSSPAMAALTARDPNQVLQRASLLAYVHTRQRDLFSHYAAQLALAKSELATAATAKAAMVTSHNAMVGDAAARTAADVAAARIRVALAAFLKTQLGHSLTRVQAGLYLRTLAAA